MKNNILILICFCFYSCSKNENNYNLDKPHTDVNYIYNLLELKIRPVKALYAFKTKQLINTKRINVGLNKVPNRIKFLVCVLEYSHTDLIIVKNEIAKNNSIRKIDFIHSKEIYEYWLPIDIKKRFMQSTIKDNLVITNPIFTLNNYFSNSIKPNSLNYDGFCFIEKNYVYIYKVLSVK